MGGFQRPQLPDLHQTGGLSEAVENVVSRGHFIAENVVLAGQDHRHAGFVPFIIHGAVADADA